MPRKPAPPPPSQDRSRDSLRRMLEAAEVVIARHGIEGATLPRIARQARLSPANVYRRFRDKQALLRAVFERLTERSSAETSAQFDPDSIRPLGLVVFARRVIEGMIRGYRANAALSRAAVHYSEENWNVGFVRKARASEAQSFQKMVDAFLIWRDEIRHPDPEYAVRFAFVMVALALRELILFGRTHNFADIIALDDESLARELTRLFLRYLGAEAG